MVAYPLTVELTNQSLADAFFPVLFISCLMVMMLRIEGIFLEDYEDGFTEDFDYWWINLSISIYKDFSSLVLYWYPCLNFWIFIQYWSRKYSLFIYFAFEAFLLVSTYIFLILFCLGNSLSLTKGSVLGTLITMPFLLPMLVYLEN